ncbi:MAG: hypothetical protein ABIH82_05560 [Candidatus Woesearchaeota archaeon]
MKIKKEWIALFVALLIVINIFNIIITLTITENKIGNLTGKVVQGQASICIVKPSSFEIIPNLNATVNQLFSYQINVTFYGNNSSVAYYDNTSLFNINQSGFITFTPSSSQTGEHYILLIAEDNSGCLAVNSTTNFPLNITGVTTLTPTPSGAVVTPGQEGDSGIIIETSPSFEITPNSFKATIKENRNKEFKTTITNNGNVELNFELNDIPSFAEANPNSFTLAPGESQEITLTINVERGIHVATIEVSAGDLKDYLTLIIESESLEVLFDVNDINLENDQLPKGATSLKATISFRATTEFEEFQTAQIIYSILDLDGNTLYTEQEEINPNNVVLITRNLNFGNLPEGRYLLAVKILIEDSYATALKEFTIGTPTRRGTLAGSAYAIGENTEAVGFIIISIFLLIIVILTILLFLHIRTKKHHTMLHNKPQNKITNKLANKPLINQPFKSEQMKITMKDISLNKKLSVNEIKEDISNVKRKISILKQNSKK